MAAGGVEGSRVFRGLSRFRFRWQRVVLVLGSLQCVYDLYMYTAVTDSPSRAACRLKSNKNIQTDFNLSTARDVIYGRINSYKKQILNRPRVAGLPAGAFYWESDRRRT